MKTETKKKVGLGALIAGIVATIVAVTKAKAAPPEFSMSFEWDDPMPFTPDSSYIFYVGLKNLSTMQFAYRIEMWWVWGFAASFGGTVQPGNTGGGGSNMYMPHEPGVYQLTAKLWINDVYIGEFVLSEVEVI